MGLLLSLLHRGLRGETRKKPQEVEQAIRSPEAVSFSSLPPEVIENIMKYAQFADIASISRLSDRFEDICQHFLISRCHMFKKTIERSVKSLWSIIPHVPIDRTVEAHRRWQVAKILKCELDILASVSWTDIKQDRYYLNAYDVMEEMDKMLKYTCFSRQVMEYECMRKLQHIFSMNEKFSAEFEKCYRLPNDRNVFWDLVETLNCCPSSIADRIVIVSHVGGCYEVSSCFEVYGCSLQYLHVDKFTEKLTSLEEFQQLKKVFTWLVFYSTRNFMLYQLEHLTGKPFERYENTDSAFVKNKLFVYGYDIRCHKMRNLNIRITMRFPPQPWLCNTQDDPLTFTEEDQINRNLLDLFNLPETCDCEIHFASTGFLLYKNIQDTYTLTVLQCSQPVDEEPKRNYSLTYDDIIVQDVILDKLKL